MSDEDTDGRRLADLEGDLSDLDRRTADRIADRIAAQWRRQYGQIEPTSHQQHHEWVARRIRQCERATDLAWYIGREALRWALLGALGGLAWALWELLRSQLGG